MPPKEPAKRKKKKGPPPPQLARPEPTDADEIEASMLWDRIHSIGPNPLSARGGVFNSNTVSIMDSGPLPSVVVGMASASKPELPQGSGKAPCPPPRQIPQTARGVYRLQHEEDTTRKARDTKDGLLQDHEDILNVVHTARETHKATRTDFVDTIKKLKEEKEERDAEQQQKIDSTNHQFETMKYRLEEELQVLNYQRPDVEANLADKKFVLSEIADKKKQLERMKQNHAARVLSMQKELAEERRTMQVTMQEKLKETLQKMANLTTAQREMRQQRAVSESGRLITELMTLERQSRELNNRNTTLLRRAEAARRDMQLEKDRKSLLKQKNSKLSQEIHKLVKELQTIEKQYHTAANSPEERAQLEFLTQTVDKQYQTILELKETLDGLTLEEEEFEQRKLDIGARKIAEYHRAVVQDNNAAATAAAVVSLDDRTTQEEGTLVVEKTENDMDEGENMLLLLEERRPKEEAKSSSRVSSSISSTGRKQATNKLRSTTTTTVLSNNTASIIPLAGGGGGWQEHDDLLLHSGSENAEQFVESQRRVVYDSIREIDKNLQQLGQGSLDDASLDPGTKLMFQNYVVRRLNMFSSGLFPKPPPSRKLSATS